MLYDIIGQPLLVSTNKSSKTFRANFGSFEKEQKTEKEKSRTEITFISLLREGSTFANLCKVIFCTSFICNFRVNSIFCNCKFLKLPHKIYFTSEEFEHTCLISTRRQIQRSKANGYAEIRKSCNTF